MKILKFSLPTCRPCIVLSEQMKSLDLANYEVVDINLKENLETIALGEKYSIKSVPTLVLIDEEGNELKRVRNIIQLKELLNTTFIFEDNTKGIETGKVYVVGIDDYKEESTKSTWISKIKNIFK